MEKYSVKLLNKIAACGVKKFGADKYEVGADVEHPDGIMVRSADMHEMALEDNLLAIARAGAGVNNIPIDACSERGIVVFNTPGANANAVKELAVAALLLASRDIFGGICWANSLKGTEGVAAAVEKGKSKFAGHEIKGQTLGILGLGAIGAKLADAAVALGMKVVGCDPFLSEEAKSRLNPQVTLAEKYEDLYAVSDYISIHVPALPTTKGMINAETIGQMKDGVRVLNLARDTLVDAKAMKEALAAGKVGCYVTDFPTEETVGVPGIVAIPHLGASTEESEDNCAMMAAAQLDDYIQNGNIKNSVNYPNAYQEFENKVRMCIAHKNVPGTLAKITGVLSGVGVNIEHMLDKSKKDLGYSILDTDTLPSDEALKALSALPEVIRVRVIQK